eukprot:CAMPEP_0196570914 /NCGR_PEP_ID=MMETSP1081-20130531/1069_1 /TAXON_ID=36882 /ORGANISM="Pyramimonas amylifera, Strain CCMP720" /LENGTH=419 /DNA_ID=CAMNT_0041887605 /DNA_START=333 /DNA_END=1592 /DNA_ORIENTATION=-
MSHVPGCNSSALMQVPAPGSLGQITVEREWLYKYDSERMAYAHMAMITVLPNGTGLMAWQAAPESEGHKTQHLEFSRSVMPMSQAPDHGVIEWTHPFRLSHIGGRGGAVWGPVFHVSLSTSELWVFYSESGGACPGGPPSMDWAPGGSIMATVLNLQTHLWTRPLVLLSQGEEGGIPKVTANKMVELWSGEWLLPFWRESALISSHTPACKALKGHPSAGVLRSFDRGKTWTAHGKLMRHDTWLIENTLAELRNGTVLMLFRTRIGQLYRSLSKDRGLTWSDAAPLGHPMLPNPNSKVDVISLHPSGVLALVFNDHAKPPGLPGPLINCVKCRTNLRVALSFDDGNTWDRVATIEDQIGTTLRFHYPTLQQYGCSLFVAYSKFWSQKLSPGELGFTSQGIKLARLHLDDLDNVANFHKI